MGRGRNKKMRKAVLRARVLARRTAGESGTGERKRRNPIRISRGVLLATVKRTGLKSRQEMEQCYRL
jgi:hypothetical protein